MAAVRSSLSAGEIVNDILAEDEAVKALATKVYPIAVDEAILPYIVYRRTELTQGPTIGARGADTVSIDVYCYAAEYGQSVELAEAVRNALDNISARSDDGSLTMRSCVLSNAEELWADNAYTQILTFTIKI